LCCGEGISLSLEEQVVVSDEKQGAPFTHMSQQRQPQQDPLLVTVTADSRILV
jgi:hypothetical protein